MTLHWRYPAAVLLAAVATGPLARTANAGDVAVYNWSGLYLGATAGGAWSKDNLNLDATGSYLTPDASSFSALGSSDFSDKSSIFGGKIGFNGQYESWVLGLEGDWSHLRIRQSADIFGRPFSDPSLAYYAHFDETVSSDWVATLRGRAGYAFDNLLVYGTAGLAFGNQRLSASEYDHAPQGTGDGSSSASASGVKAGWAAGGGIDYALSASWIISAEYLHIDLGKVDATTTIDTGKTAILNYSTKLESDIVRAGIAYKFATP